MRSRASGFTLIEALIVMVVVGVLAGFSLPRLRNAIDQTNVRSARVAFGNLAIKARAAAVHRGCAATLNFTTGSAGTVWVTACKVSQSGVDTIGTVEHLATRFGVSISSASSAIQYTPRGFSIGSQATTVTFTTVAGGTALKDSTVLDPLGKVVR